MKNQCIGHGNDFGCGRTLYVSDLDGTLLRSDERISEFSCSVINDLVRRGMLFSYATARSLVTAEKVTKGLTAALPVITYNGAFVIDSADKSMLLSNFFSEGEARSIRDVLISFDVYPIVYAFIDGVERFSFHTGHINPGMAFFLNNRQNDVRRTPVEDMDAMYRGEVFYFSCIGEESELLPVYEALKGKAAYHCIFQQDIYSHAQWLEILPAGATKANAALQLKKLLGCDKIVAFGDNKNDISLFQIADECYAVENAAPELKAIATGIIGGNDRDGVATWLLNNVKA
jgi:Cof subfamily protein (haloacid dehalogenase superfamily)